MKKYSQIIGSRIKFQVTKTLIQIKSIKFNIKFFEWYCARVEFFKKLHVTIIQSEPYKNYKKDKYITADLNWIVNNI